MKMVDEKKGELVSKAAQIPVKSEANSIVLSNTNTLPTEGLTEEQVQQLRIKQAEGMLDLNKKAQELNIDVLVLDRTLGTMAAQTAQVSKAGDSVTMTHSHTSSLGRTEVIMGNTSQAATGKLSKSQTGEDDNTLKYVLIAAAVIIVVALIAFAK
jgi:hypothetical protein